MTAVTGKGIAKFLGWFLLWGSVAAILFWMNMAR